LSCVGAALVAALETESRAGKSPTGSAVLLATFMVRGEPAAHEDSEERSDEESGWGKAWIHEPPPRSLAALGMTPLLYDRWQTGIRRNHG